MDLVPGRQLEMLAAELERSSVDRAAQPMEWAENTMIARQWPRVAVHMAVSLVAKATKLDLLLTMAHAMAVMELVAVLDMTELLIVVTVLNFFDVSSVAEASMMERRMMTNYCNQMMTSLVGS